MYHNRRNNYYHDVDLVMAMTFHTNVQTYGPLGDYDVSEHMVELRGYKLVGFHGRVGHALDNVGAYFELCDEDNAGAA